LRHEHLRAELGNGQTVDPPFDAGALVEALRSVNDLQLDPALIAAVASLFGPEVDRESRLELLRAVTNDPDGRFVTGEVFAERTSERIEDARRAMAAYQTLLDDPDTNET
jgi:hypothetical protein